MKPTITLIFIFAVIFTTTTVNSLGIASTTAITYNTSTICGIVASKPHQYIQCYQNKKLIPIVLPNVSFQSISGGRSFFCGLRSNGLSFYCWDTRTLKSFLEPRRLYYSENVQLSDVAVGDDQVCARELHSGIVRCWRGYGGNNGVEFPSPDESFRFRTVTCGSSFCCGILKVNNTVFCWGENGENGVENLIQKQFTNLSMSTLVSGVSHVCGLNLNGVLICKGKNNNNDDSGKLNVPLNSSSVFSALALGENFTCGIRIKNGLVQCWGGDFGSDFDSDNVNNHVMKSVSFESIVAGLDFVCGLTTRDLSLICWGNPNWYSKHHFKNDVYVPLGMILPGPCVKDDSCNSCGVYPNSDFLCHGFGSICYQCRTELPIAVQLPPPLSTSSSSPNKQPSLDNEEKGTRGWKLMTFLIIGSVGAFAGLCTILYFVMIGSRRLLRSKIDNSVQPTSSESDDAYVDIAPMQNVGTINNNGTSTLRSFSSKRHSSGRLRSGSSSKQLDRTESFSFWELIAACNNFSMENKIGSGSFGCVYKGRLFDGREVAIKRGDTCLRKKKFQEKETAFDSELTLLSRLHHKHLVRLIGFCEENDERLLVYEYMSNGSLHDHLHDKNNVEKNSSIMNSWKMRIKVALDAARGIEYIHNYAVPPIIHRDIKSSNILIDSNWNARVSDFGLSLIWQETEQELMSNIQAVGTVGYIDPEYYVLNVLTTKSDVYGLGVVMLELLTGKRAVFKNEGESDPIGVVEYAGGKIGTGEVWNLLDHRVGIPEVNEVESVEIMAYTAMHCVNLEGKDRPNMVDIVANLERALAFLEGSPGSFSMSSL
ncbi:serine/threonine protein kinase-like protein CCR3-like [Trifolium pratense]|uniref:Serine/threonine protein kinase-like protein CCR3-like n=1 Tax=Trifolium pratense TaxID=57577 RepID=A0A2K3NEE4_TRIPR|nr:serine/threonine protein kinase-like protein CCR3-like [Trifolium pratense]